MSWSREVVRVDLGVEMLIAERDGSGDLFRPHPFWVVLTQVNFWFARAACGGFAKDRSRRRTVLVRPRAVTEERCSDQA
jgi:hypothetical protein